MTGPTHVITGLAAAVAIGRLTEVPPSGVELLAIIVGSVAPDIDGGGVITRPGTILRGFLGRTVAGLVDAVFGIVVVLVETFFSHRGFMHSPFLAACLILAGMLTGYEWLAWFSVGYAVHLFGDALTVMGIPMGSPFSARRISLSRLRTGSRMEFAIAGVFVCLTAIYGWVLLPDGVKKSHEYLYERIAQNLS